MAPRLVFLLLALAVPTLMAAPLAQPQAPSKDRPRTDALGDPLPAGAVARLGTTRLLHLRHDFGFGVHAAFTPDGRQIATLGWGDTVIHFWDAATGKEVRQLKSPTQSLSGVTGFSFSPDGTLIAIHGRDIAPNDNLFVCEVSSGKVLWRTAAAERPPRPGDSIGLFAGWPCAGFG